MLSSVSGFAYANGGIVNVQGMASTTYAGNKITTKEKQQAFTKAEQNAIVRYYARNGDSSTANFSTIEQSVMDNLPNYILGTSVISQVDHRSLHMYQISLQVQLNSSLLDNAIKSASAVEKTPGYQKQKIGFFFVAREVRSARDYEVRSYQRTEDSYHQNLDGDKSNNGNESQSLNGGSIGVGSNDQRAESFSDRTSETQQAGGSLLHQSTKYRYILLTSQNLDTVFEGDFSQAGYVGIPAAFIAPKSNGLINVDAIKNEYKAGRNIEPNTLASIANAMQLVQIPYFAVGSLNVGLPRTDPNTGLKEVVVSVDATIYNVESQFPIVVTAVGPEQFSGLGPTRQAALTNAIKNAANKTALDMVSRLNEQSVN